MSGTKLAGLVSYVFHPLLMPFYILVLLLNRDNLLPDSLPLTFRMTLAGIVFLTTILFPLFLTWILFRMRLISSVYLSEKEERVYPLLAISVFYYLTWFLLKGIHISTIFSYYMLGATFLAILSMIVTFYRKISLHLVAAGSFTGLFLGLSMNFGVGLFTEILAGILLSGILGYSRIKTGAHQPAEVYSGFAMGAIVMTLLMIML